jgi:hypothetical protein
MGMNWNDLSGTLQSKLEQEILNYSENVVDRGESSETKERWIGPKLSSQKIFLNFLQGCKDLDYRWNLKTRVREAIFSAFCQCFHPSQPVYAKFLMQMLVGVKWSDVSTDLKITLFETLNMRLESLNLTEVLQK